MSTNQDKEDASSGARKPVVPGGKESDFIEKNDDEV